MIYCNMQYTAIVCTVLIAVCALSFVEGKLEPKDLTFVILSQTNKWNLKTARNLELDIYNQSFHLKQDYPTVYLSHEMFHNVGGWTILPFLTRLSTIAKNSSWVVIIEERTVIRLINLLGTLNKYNSSKNVWLGYSLFDETPTIIHHFQEKFIGYPHLGAGIAISNTLLANLSKIYSGAKKTPEFSIDGSFELALFIWNKGNGPALTHDNSFCPVNTNETCASFPKSFMFCDAAVATSSIYFAVKTCEQFHKTRVPVVLDTWAKYAEKINFFSDVEDNSIPTITVGVENVVMGHCVKTIRIFRKLLEIIEDDYEVEWIVLADDDTILSVKRLTELLSCYDSEDDVAIGERYGYDVHNRYGYNYITGGGGMVFSRKLLEKILAKSCYCHELTSPDDMTIGQCLKEFEVQVTHSHLFHQARPMDYSPDLLKSDRHISFHKHWEVDPREIYNKWFAEEDSKIRINRHTEL